MGGAAGGKKTVRPTIGIRYLPTTSRYVDQLLDNKKITCFTFKLRTPTIIITRSISVVPAPWHDADDHADS